MWACRKNFFLLENFSPENTKFGAENLSVRGESIRGKIEILTTRVYSGTLQLFVGNRLIIAAFTPSQLC